MTAARIRQGAEARRLLLDGVDLVARCVGATFGPGGRYVAIDSGGVAVEVTREGAAVARQVLPECDFARQGAELVKLAADRVSDRFGDGSTTAVLLTASLLRRCLRLVEAGHAPVALAAEVGLAGEAVKNRLAADARPAREREIRQAALAAGRDETLADHVAQAFAAGGATTPIVIRRSRVLGWEMQPHNGFRFERGLSHPGFADPATGALSLAEPVICLADLPLTMADAGKLIGRARWIGRPLVVITEAAPPEVLEALVAHARTSDVPVVPIGAPWQGPRRRDFLDDLAAVTGASVLLPELMSSFAAVRKEHLGSASLVVVERDATTVVGGDGDDQQRAERVDVLDRTLAATELKYERDRLLERRGRLAGRTWALGVGAPTDQEEADLRRRARGTIAAARAAAAGGVVAGGGFGLLRAARAVADGGRGSNVVLGAAGDLVRVLLANAGIEPARALGEMPAQGTFEARTGRWTSGDGDDVVDARLVVEAALEASLSVAGVTLSSELIVLAE